MTKLYRLILFIAFLFSITVQLHAQKYDFDTFTEYEYIKDSKSPVYKTFELTNSKDNSYIVSLVEKDELTFILFFKDGKGTAAAVPILKKDFFRAENINIECGYLKKTDLRVADMKGFNFYKLNDTIIKKDTLQHYTFKSNDAKVVKKEGEQHFIIQKNTEFHLPNLTPGSKERLMWQMDANSIPNGLSRQSYIVLKNKIIEKTILLQYAPVKKSIIIPKDCGIINK